MAISQKTRRRAWFNYPFLTQKERDNETGLDYFGARYYSSTQGRFTSVDPSTKSIALFKPQTWNRYIYASNNPLFYLDRNGKWPEPTHDKIIATALQQLGGAQLTAVQRGSAKVDRDGWKVKTLLEKNAPQHAMTPGVWVKMYGLETAKRMAKTEAGNFVIKNVESAKSAFEQSLKTNDSKAKAELETAALEYFGAAMHAVTDRYSPEHCDFQVYDPYDHWSLGNPAGLVFFGAQMGLHLLGESRNPTNAEMSVMGTEIRFWFKYAFGDGYYRKVVPPLHQFMDREAFEGGRIPEKGCVR